MIRRVKKRKAPPKMCAVLRSDVIKLERYVEQYMFLCKHDLKNVGDVADYAETATNHSEIKICDRILKHHEEIKEKLDRLADAPEQKHERQAQMKDVEMAQEL